MTRAALSLTLLLITMPCAAKPRRAPPAPSPEKAAAAALLNEGNEAYTRGDYARAMEKYEAAYGKFASPKILFNLAETRLALKQLGAAAELYDRFMQSPSADQAPDRLLRARQRLAQLQPQVGQVRVTAMPPDARVELDGEAVPADRIASRVFVDPGAHQLRAHDDGSLALQRTFSVEAGKVVNIDLTPPPPPPAVRPAPAAPPRVIVVTQAAPAPRRSVFRSPAVIAGIATTVALGAALVGTGSAALVFHDQYTDPTRSLSSRDFARRTGDGLAWASEGLLIGAAVSAVVTTTVALLLYKRDRRAR